MTMSLPGVAIEVAAGTDCTARRCGAAAVVVVRDFVEEAHEATVLVEGREDQD